MTLVPSALVDESGRYKPSEELTDQIESMWRSRSPRQVGLVSERMASEIVNGGKIRRQGECWPLECEPFKKFASTRGLSLTPDFGPRSDDIITIADSNGRDLVFVTESKGTVQERGFSHSVEAKIFYQLPMTVQKLREELNSDGELRLGGIISVQSNHYAKVVTINLIDYETSLAKETPGPWYYSKK